MFELHKLTVLEIPTALTSMGFFISNYTMNHETIHQFLQSKDEHFDLVIMEIFMNEAMHGFGHHFGAPMIGFSTFGASTWSTDLVGSPSPMSYVPNAFLSFSDKMSFWQRLGNIAFSLYEDYQFQSYMKLQSRLYESVFPRKDKPALADLRKNVSLVLLNNHVTMNFPRPYAPNMIEVGGIHINRNAARPLPKDILEFVEGAEHGCVYFSMGSILKSTDMSSQLRDDILKAFSKLKQRVLWKWEDENLPGKPDNVFIAKWFPQDDLLAHKNVKLFITHGGLLSSTEAVYYGVPIIGIPVFGDQKLNMARAVNGGYGLTIDYDALTEASLSAALSEMLGNDK